MDSSATAQKLRLGALVAAGLLTAMASEGGSTHTVTIGPVKRDTVSKITATFVVAREPQEAADGPAIEGRLRIQGGPSDTLAVTVTRTETKGTYALSLTVNFSGYIEQDNVREASITLASDLDGNFTRALCINEPP
jgi:hypothetical protein